MKKIVAGNPAFFVLFFLFVCAGAFLLIVYPKASLFLFVNNHHHFFLDSFFKLMTNLGDGFFFLTVSMVLFFFRIRDGLLSLISFAVTGLFAQLLKRTLFSNAVRPEIFFEHYAGIHYVEGVDVHAFNSFPSGHAVSAFALFSLLALLGRGWLIGVCCFMGAVLVAYSRIYLCQHFFEDVYAGALIGVTGNACIFYLLRERKNYLDRTSWADKPLTALFQKHG